jgi:hypothetical protein
LTSAGLIQKEDELCKEIRNYLENGELHEKYGNKKPDWAKEIGYFEIQEGVLYRRKLVTIKSRINEMNHGCTLIASPLGVERNARRTDGWSSILFTNKFEN